MTKTFILALAFAVFGFGQLRIPVAGYSVNSASTEVRPILGAPGAALIGDPITLPQGASSLVLSPNQQFAILTGDRLAVAPLGPDGFGEPAVIAGAMSNPDRVEFSAVGSVAVLYSAAQEKIQVLAGLPNAPRVSAEFAFHDELAALAVNDDASAVLAAKSDGGVLLLSSERPIRLLMSGNSIAALQFLTNTQALAVDPPRNQLLLLGGLAGNPSVQTLADASTGIDDPGGLQITADHRRALLANSGAGNLLNIDLETSEIVFVECAFRPVAVRPLLKSGAYLVTDDQGRNVWMFDSGASRVLYVPARDR
ncbi:MAG: hypothetical protein M3Y27_11165 [Acidobacteriota bacterium]|nr:hypothetical protein [Acidobacteriota bacterium]